MSNKDANQTAWWPRWKRYIVVAVSVIFGTLLLRLIVEPGDALLQRMVEYSKSTSSISKWVTSIMCALALAALWHTRQSERRGTRRSELRREILIRRLSRPDLAAIHNDDAISVKSNFGGTIGETPVRDERVLSTPRSFYDQVIQITFEYIESYYKQTQTQAARSFFFSVFAAVMSFLIISVGVTMMYGGSTTGASVTVAVGAFSQFISAVFFYLYNRTVMKMGEYHQKLVMTQNAMMAIKLTEDLNENDKSKARIELVKALTKDLNKYLSPIPLPDVGPPRARARSSR